MSNTSTKTQNTLTQNHIILFGDTRANINYQLKINPKFTYMVKEPTEKKWCKVKTQYIIDNFLNDDDMMLLSHTTKNPEMKNEKMFDRILRNKEVKPETPKTEIKTEEITKKPVARLPKNEIKKINNTLQSAYKNIETIENEKNEIKSEIKKTKAEIKEIPKPIVIIELKETEEQNGTPVNNSEQINHIHKEKMIESIKTRNQLMASKLFSLYGKYETKLMFKRDKLIKEVFIQTNNDNYSLTIFTKLNKNDYYIGFIYNDKETNKTYKSGKNYKNQNDFINMLIELINDHNVNEYQLFIDQINSQNQ